MSDEVAHQFEQQQTPGNEEPGRSVTLSITLHPNGQLDLSGPLANKILSYGLLGAATSKLDEMWTLKTLEEQAVKAQASRGGIPGLLKRMNGG